MISTLILRMAVEGPIDIHHVPRYPASYPDRNGRHFDVKKRVSVLPLFSFLIPSFPFFYLLSGYLLTWSAVTQSGTVKHELYFASIRIVFLVIPPMFRNIVYCVVICHPCRSSRAILHARKLPAAYSAPGTQSPQDDCS